MPTLLVITPLLAILLLNLPLNFLRKLALPFGVLFALYQVLAALGVAQGCCCGAGFLSRIHSPFTLVVDDLGRVLLLSIAIVSLAALLTSRATVTEERRRFQFVNLVLLTVAGMNGLVMVRDLFSLYVFLEITSIASFILIAFFKDMAGLEGAFKYLVMSAVATAMLLGAIALLFMLSGDTTFAAAAAALHARPTHALALLAMALFLGGLLIKAGLVPFHGWLPDAYTSAPAAASVLLAGIVTKTTGVYVLIRLARDIFGLPVPEPVQALLLIAGAVSAVVGALAALGQNDLKRMLAYSSISQVGYIILGLGAGTALGVAGAIFHLFNHAIFKTLLFVNAAAVEKQTGTRNMDALGGLAARMPVTSSSALLAMLSTAGVPPLSGFWSKLVIVIALWQAGHWGYAFIAIGASLLTLAYFLSLTRRVFFGQLRAGLEPVREAGWALAVPAVVLAAVVVGVGVLVPWLFGTFLLPVSGL